MIDCGEIKAWIVKGPPPNILGMILRPTYQKRKRFLVDDRHKVIFTLKKRKGHADEYSDAILRW
jgi:hypothetical protein